MQTKRHCLYAAMALAVLVGCSRPPQVASENRRLIESLSTAVSAKRTDWLDANVKKIDERHDKGEMTDTEYGAFQAIVAKAKAGDWAAAQLDVLELGHAQQPTPEELDRLKASRGKPK